MTAIRLNFMLNCKKKKKSKKESIPVIYGFRFWRKANFSSLSGRDLHVRFWFCKILLKAYGPYCMLVLSMCRIFFKILWDCTITVYVLYYLYHISALFLLTGYPSSAADTECVYQGAWGYWKDWSCSHSMRFICEKSPGKISLHYSCYYGPHSLAKQGDDALGSIGPFVLFVVGVCISELSCLNCCRQVWSKNDYYQDVCLCL